MSKKIFMVALSLLLICSSWLTFTTVSVSPGQIYEAEEMLSYRNVTVYAPAVAQTDIGYVGVISTITVTIQNGTGRVFVDTLPLTQIDMQGSARLAVKVASNLVKSDDNCTEDPSNYDYFFVVRTSAPIIGGPSAGAIMTVATIALLERWDINNWTVMTGMINPDGSVGPIGGTPQKIDAAHSVGATRFLIPKGQGTYIETIVERVKDGTWSRITTRQETRSVYEYAEDNYGMEVVEVEDVNDALRYFTGFNFTQIETDGNITTEGYINAMKPLATTLLNNAGNLYENASNLLANSSIPNIYPLYFEEQIGNILLDAEYFLEGSQGWYNQGLYYSSTSKSFNSLIDSRFVVYACEYFNADDGDQYIIDLIDEVAEVFEEESEKAQNAEIEGAVSLQCVGAAQKRASEAYSFLSDASTDYQADPLGALYNLARAMERSNSVGWWIDISTYFNNSGEISTSQLENLATEYIEDAQQATIYSRLIFQELEKTSSYVSSAEDLLDAARDELQRSYPAAALFDALEALTKANLALETIDNDIEGKIPRARESAGASITQSITLGLEPVLAIGYYEYGQSLENESSFSSALMYYKYSNLISGAISITNFSSGGVSSRYVGMPEVTTPRFGFSINFIYFAIIGAIGGLVLGGIAGLGLGLIISSISGEKEGEKPAKPQKEKWVEDYYKKQNRFFPDKQIPKSIKDYYKRNK